MGLALGLESETGAPIDHTSSLLPRGEGSRQQGMRGLACFRRDESLAQRPRTPDPCVARRRPLSLRSAPD
jgi:hypothetical protein